MATKQKTGGRMMLLSQSSEYFPYLGKYKLENPKETIEDGKNQQTFSSQQG
jgi:hypothetical protein